MSIKIQCPRCGVRCGVNERLAGRKTHCPSCDAEIKVPTLEAIQAAKAKREAARAVAAPAAQPSKPVSASKSSAPPVSQEPKKAEDKGFEELPLGAGRKKVEAEMDMTPMVDVTFLLLIFFMVTASFSLQKSIALPPQQSDAPSSSPVEKEQEEMDQVSLQVNEFGGFLVLAADWEREVAGKPALVAALREAKQSLGAQVRLAIECHEAAELQHLVNAMDAGALCEYTEMQVTQVDGF